jgi:quercetin dioxygenase-like cupin family protein
MRSAHGEGFSWFDCPAHSAAIICRMKIFRGEEIASELADPKTFLGRAQIKRLASADDGVPVVVYRVAFEDGGRTNWHVHSGAQWLMVLDGRVRVQRWGEASQEVAAGDAVMIAPGDKHWHGAAPGGTGVHLAVNVYVTTEWLEPVSDEQYRL